MASIVIMRQYWGFVDLPRKPNPVCSYSIRDSGQQGVCGGGMGGQSRETTRTFPLGFSRCQHSRLRRRWGLRPLIRHHVRAGGWPTTDPIRNTHYPSPTLSASPIWRPLRRISILLRAVGHCHREIFLPWRCWVGFLLELFVIGTFYFPENTLLFRVRERSALAPQTQDQFVLPGSLFVS